MLLNMTRGYVTKASREKWAEKSGGPLTAGYSGWSGMDGGEKRRLAVENMMRFDSMYVSSYLDLARSARAKYDGASE